MSPRREIFRPVVRRVVTLVAGLSAVCTLVAIVWGAKLSAPAPTDSDSFATGPLGHRAFHDSLRELGVHVLRGRRADVLTNDAPALFIEPSLEAFLDGDRVTLSEVIIERQIDDYATLVVLPKWAMTRDDEGEERAVWVGERASDVLTAATGEVGSIGHLGSATELAEWEATGPLGSFRVTAPWLQTVDVPNATVLLEVEGRPIAVWHDGGTLILSDPDILHSYNHHRTDNAEVALAVVRDLGSDAVVIDEVFHGHGQQRSLAAALGEFPASLILVQGLLLVVLVVARGARRFGPPEPEPGLGRGPAESIAVSASVLARGRSTGNLLQSYLHEVLDDVAARLQLREGDAGDIALEVDAISKRRGEPERAEELLARATALATRPRPRLEEILEVAREAHELHRRMTRRDATSTPPTTTTSMARRDEPMETTEVA